MASVCWALGRKASPGPQGTGLLFRWHLCKNHEVKQSSSLVRSGTRSAQVSPRELKLSSLQDIALPDHSTRQEFFQKLQRQLPIPKELVFHLLLGMQADPHIWLQALRCKVRLLVSSLFLSYLSNIISGF